MMTSPAPPTPMPNDAVTFSAPGKILLAGGYLVLESPNPGFVVAADKRFYCTVGPRKPDAPIRFVSGSSPSSSSSRPPDIRVFSPQFHSQWDYYVQTSSTNNNNLKDFKLTAASTNGNVNPFVEKTLRVCLMYLLSYSSASDLSFLSSDNIFPLDITIKADNDFYSVLPHLPTSSEDAGSSSSSSVQRTPSVVSSLPKFLNCPQDPVTGKPIVHKTGLGSSAALTTSLVGAIVHYYFQTQRQKRDQPESFTPPNRIDTLIHNLAQICHCHAQGKVGSGFDVSSACHGTHVYRRFPKCLLPDLLQQLDHSSDNDDQRSTIFLLRRIVEMNSWTGNNNDDDDVDGNDGNNSTTITTTPMVSSPRTLPSQLQILLADVRGGSESPSMARTVLKWKASAAESESSNNSIPFWDDLKTLNRQVIDIMNQLVQIDSDDMNKDNDIYDRLSKSPASEWSKLIENNLSSSSSSTHDERIGRLLVDLHTTFGSIRSNLRQMGEAANVPIEPPPQTKLCDATMTIPGVVTAVVPGAGGYDAIVCLYIDRPHVLNQIGQLWSTWEEPIICPLAVQASETGMRLES